MNATIKLEKEHFPVLLDKIISIISPLYGGTFIDCTFGHGGYSKKILENQKNKVIAIDRDKKTLVYANQIKNKFGDRFYYKNIKFSEIKELELKKNEIKAIIFDLGYSISQISDIQKGLSFKTKGKLNMRMGLNEFSADEVVNTLSQKDLEKIFKFFGEEKKSKLISKKIFYKRNMKRINTEELVKIVNSVKKNKSKIHNATKIFQGLRIFVNKEISQIINGLINSFEILPIGGMLVVVTFNSIEDKIVKFFFKNYSENKNVSRYLPNYTNNHKCFELLEKKPILPSLKEIKDNPPSRSAKLRYAIKIDKNNNFKEFLKKFQYLIDIENLSQNL